MQQIRSVLRHQLTDVVLYGVVIGGSPLISRVFVGSAARNDVASQLNCGDAEEFLDVATLVRSYLDGNQVDLSGIVLDRERQTPFVSAVQAAALGIGFGHTCSYSVLARNAGYPGAIRAAASVMRNNRWPLLVPCHRIIRKDGSAGAYNGDSGGDDAALKKKLLQMEQIHLKQ